MSFSSIARRGALRAAGDFDDGIAAAKARIESAADAVEATAPGLTATRIRVLEVVLLKIVDLWPTRAVVDGKVTALEVYRPEFIRQTGIWIADRWMNALNTLGSAAEGRTADANERAAALMAKSSTFVRDRLTSVFQAELAATREGKAGVAAPGFRDDMITLMIFTLQLEGLAAEIRSEINWLPVMEFFLEIAKPFMFVTNLAGDAIKSVGGGLKVVAKIAGVVALIGLGGVALYFALRRPSGERALSGRRGYALGRARSDDDTPGLGSAIIAGLFGGVLGSATRGDASGLGGAARFAIGAGVGGVVGVAVAGVGAKVLDAVALGAPPVPELPPADLGDYEDAEFVDED